MARPTASGRHEFWYEGDLLGVRFRGPITREAVEALRDAVNAVTAEHPRSFLIADLHECTGIDPEARKYMAVWSNEPDRGLVGTAVFGTGFMLRTLVTLTIKAIKMLGQARTDLLFFKDEAEAREWVRSERARHGGA